MSYCRPSCPDAHKPVLHSEHDDFEDAKQDYARPGLAANKLVQIMGLLCV